MDGVMLALPNKETPRNKNMYFSVWLARHELSKYSADVPPTTGMLCISAHMIHWFHKLGSYRNWDERIDINPEEETLYTTISQQAFPKYE